jgi:hypothetical protein
MRVAIAIERLRASCGSYLVGPDATKVLASLHGVSAVRLESQYIDRAVLSYEWSDAGHEPATIDQTLWSKGMRRVR